MGNVSSSIRALCCRSSSQSTGYEDELGIDPDSENGLPVPVDKDLVHVDADVVFEDVHVVDLSSPPETERAAETERPAKHEDDDEHDEHDEHDERLNVAAAEIRTALMDLRANDAWSIYQKLQPVSLAALEILVGLPLGWLEAWGRALDIVTVKLRSQYPPCEKDWHSFPCTQADDGMSGTIHVYWVPGDRAVQIRSELFIPGPFTHHFEGLVELDLASEVCPHLYGPSTQHNSTIPGNFLFHLVVKPPKLPRRLWRDIVLHRQLIRWGTGVAGVEYSPKCFPVCSAHKCALCRNYFAGGEWHSGLPGVPLPPCIVSGRDAQYAGYTIEHGVLNGEEGVWWRNCQIVEHSLPSWVPVPKTWYCWVAAFILRRTLREFAAARRDGANQNRYAQRVAARPSWYNVAWYAPRGPQN